MLPILHISSRFSAEVAFVVLCCRVCLGTASASELQDFIKQHQLNWDMVYRLSAAHGIRPVVYNVCASSGSDIIPEKFLARLKKQCRTIAVNNLAQYKELKSILKTFETAGIRIVPYKGLLLGFSLYGDLISRETGDIDMLVLPSDFPAARKIFMGLGYENRLFYNERFEGYFINADREFKFTRYIADSDVKINIEVQWKPLHPLMGIPLQNGELFQHLERSAAPDMNYEVLSPDDELLVLFAHHGVADVWRKLKHVLDISLFAKKYGGNIAWNVFTQKVSANKMNGFAAAGAYLSEALLGINIPLPQHNIEKIKPGILSGTLQFPLLSTEKKDKNHLQRHLMLSGPLTEKASFLCRYILLWLKPNMRDMEGVNLPPLLFPLYYVIRRFRFLRGKLEKK